MKKIFIIICLLHTIFSIAQGEANNWFFGEFAGLNFNSDTPIATTGRLNTKEGCASFSDKNGDLLFYTDGRSVWDKTHTVMPSANGTLKGHPSSTQSAIIVPHPGNTNLFYIFTVGARVGDDGEFGFHSYIVDITKNNGLGDINGSGVSLTGSGLLNDLWTEKVTSVKGADCNSFWVISLVQNTYYSYKIDITGLNETPVISKVEYVSEDKRGYLKVSPDGKKLASATFTQGTTQAGENYIGPGKLHLYSFNDATGEISNDAQLLISDAEIDGAPYGVEFSSNSSKLYTSTFDGDNNKLFQFDLSSSTISASKYLVNSQIGYRGALQLAPNGKIYTTIPVDYSIGTKYLNVINLPDQLGSICDYQARAIDLGSGKATQGLPPFIASLLLPIEIIDNHTNEIITNQVLKLCVGSDYSFNTPALTGTPVYTWKKDGVVLTSTSSSLILDNIQLTDAGIYEVKVELIDNCGNQKTYSGKFEVEAYVPPSSLGTLIYDQCDIDDNPTDFTTLFNLNSKLESITNGDENLEVFFYKSLLDLNNNTPISNTDNYLASDSDENIIIKLTNKESGCSTTSEMELNVFPTSLDTYKTIYTCENSNSTDFKSIGINLGTFDFDGIKENIAALFLDDPNITIEFYSNTTDAQLQINSIIGVNEFSEKEIFVRVSNKLSNNCISVGKFDLVVNQIPDPKPFANDQPIILCVNNPKDNPQLISVKLDGFAGNLNDTYQWFLNNNPIEGATNFEYEATAEGIYKIEVSRNYKNLIVDLNDDSICSGFDSFEVIESSPALITEDAITVVDDTSNNTITIDANNLGLGNYQYSLDDIYSYQDQPYFENVEPGIHTLFINDKNGCGSASSIEISVLGFPKFFTPNNDGKNEFWTVSGVNAKFYAKSKINIFNRYGTLVAKIDPKGDGWDGIFNGEKLPATDYWYSAELIDNNGNIRIKKGHFSLLR